MYVYEWRLWCTVSLFTGRPLHRSLARIASKQINVNPNIFNKVYCFRCCRAPPRCFYKFHTLVLYMYVWGATSRCIENLTAGGNPSRSCPICVRMLDIECTSARMRLKNISIFYYSIWIYKMCVCFFVELLCKRWQATRNTMLGQFRSNLIRARTFYVLAWTTTLMMMRWWWWWVRRVAAATYTIHIYVFYIRICLCWRSCISHCRFSTVPREYHFYDTEITFLFLLLTRVCVRAYGSMYYIDI